MSRATLGGWRIRACAVTIAWSSSSPVRAEAAARGGRASIAIEVTSCLDVSAEEVRRIVELELHVPATSAADHDGDATRAQVDCHNPGIFIEVEDPITAKSLSRSIDPTSTPRAVRSRLVALAVVELVSASWAELIVAPEPSSLTADPRASTEARRQATEVALSRQDELTGPPFSFELMAHARKYAGIRKVIPGVSLHVAMPVSSWGRWTAEMGIERATQAVSAGDVTVSSASLSVAMLLTHRWDPFEVGAGTLARVGWALLEGTPAPDVRGHGERVSNIWTGAALTLNCRYEIRRAVVVELLTEAGYVASPVAGLVVGSRDIAIDGLWIGAGLGGGFVR